MRQSSQLPNSDQSRNGEEALGLATRLNQMMGSDALALDTLAAAYAEAGLFAEAVAAAHKAAALPGPRQPELARAIICGKLQ